jgi:hypothetical protein
MAKFVINPLNYTDLMVFEITGNEGDYLETINKQDLTPDQISQKIIVTDGEMSHEKLTGDFANDAVLKRVAGESTFETPKYAVYGQGTFRFIASNGFLKYYCISRRDKKKIIGETLRPKAEETFIVEKGKLLFLAKGSIKINGVEFDAPNLLMIQTDNKTFTALVDVLAVAIPKDW